MTTISSINTNTTSNIKKSNKLFFPKFDDNKVSTKTIIAMTNLSLNLENMFNLLEITNWTIVPKRRGRKKKIEYINPNKNIPSGSIITLKFEDKIRGVDLKKKKSKNKNSGKYFRNSVTIVMVIEGKNINFKVSRNGKFQMTGCKTNSHAEDCVKYFWQYIQKIQNSTKEDKEFNNLPIVVKEENNNIYELSRGDHLEILFIPAMRNIDFSLGFLVDREELSKYVNLMTKYYSMLETSFGYTGVNIKFPMKDKITDMKIKKLEYIEGEDEVWKESSVMYTDFLALLPEKEREKKINKQRYNTFLVFHSGKCIHRGVSHRFMIETYYEFLSIIRECYDIIEERLDN